MFQVKSIVVDSIRRNNIKRYIAEYARVELRHDSRVLQRHDHEMCDRRQTTHLIENVLHAKTEEQ